MFCFSIQYIMSLKRAKTILSDPINTEQNLSRQLLTLSKNISKKHLDINSLLNIKNNEKIILNEEVKDDQLIIFIDTETTGLQQNNKLETFTDKENNKHEFISYRNQIHEMGAICYNNNLEFESLDDNLFFHGKVKDQNLNEHNSISKLEQKLSFYLKDERIKKAFISSQEKGGKFNPVFSVFKQNFPMDLIEDKSNYESEIILKDILRYYLHSAIAEMNHSEKRTFKYIYNPSKTYEVNDSYSNELDLIEQLFSFIKTKKSKYKKITIGAHNLPYDLGMIKGAILDAIDYFTYFENNEDKLKHYKELLLTCDEIFKNQIDTIEVFREILNNKKYGNKIISLYVNNSKIKKIKLVRHLVKTLNRKKTSTGKYSAALGNLAPLSLHTDFHTTINDIYVTVETLKLYCSIPSILELIKNKQGIPEDLIPIIKDIILSDF